MIQKKIAIALLVLSSVFISCDDNDNSENGESSSQLTLNIDGLEDLGDNFNYEGWIIVGDVAITTGVFSVDSEGELSQTVFDVNEDDLENASGFALTIEPAVDQDFTPSNTKFLIGDFSGNTARLSTEIMGDFTSVAGEFILATPTDDSSNSTNNDENGIWWLNPTNSTPSSTLVLPDLDEGWKYEGWVVVDGVPVTTGTFSNVAATDDAAPFSGSDALPQPNGDNGFFPGEDFLNNAPSGVTFPLDVRGKTVVISVEPYPDNSPAPFTLKPLVGTAGQETAPTLHLMNDNVDASFPSGSVSR